MQRGVGIAHGLPDCGPDDDVAARAIVAREINRDHRVADFAERDAQRIVVAECLAKQLRGCGP
jgi:hypothetical protein